jgi:hypothetical protein
MTARALKLKVSANVPKDCNFWLEDDGWNGVCEEFSFNVRGSSFEDAKRKMEQHYRHTSRMSCVSIPGRVERRLPDRSGCWHGAS